MLQILIPMAGAGKRFQDEGYTLPKPLIPVDGVPMIIKAVSFLPKAQKYIFVCREEHIKEAHIDEVIRQQYPDSVFIPINYLTEGQASTCLLAKSEIDPNEELLIAACDNGVLYDHDAFAVAKSQYDALIWTFRNNATVARNPKAYGWVRTKDSDVLGVSVKVPISDTPTKDHAVIGAFYFQKAQDFFLAADSMIAQNRRVNNEFYVDELMNDAVQMGKKVGVFEADKYICWGTPNDLKTYEYWQRFFSLVDFHPYTFKK